MTPTKEKTPNRFLGLCKNIWYVFTRTPGGKPIGITLGITLVSIFDFLSIGAIIPLISLAADTDYKQGSKFAVLFKYLFSIFNFHPGLNGFLFIVVFFMAAKIFAAYLASNYIARTVSNIAVILRMKLLNALFSVQWVFFINHHPGNISTTIATDAETAANSYNHAAAVIAEVMKIFVAMAIALMISPTFFLLAVPALMLLFIPLGFIIRTSRSNRRKKWNKSARLISYVQDVISIMKPLKSMNRQQMHSRIFKKNISYLYQSSIKAQVGRNRLVALQECFVVISLCAIFYFGNVYFQLNLPELMIFGFVFFIISISARGLQTSAHQFAETQGSYWNFEKLVLEAEGLAESNTGDPIPGIKHSAEFKDVTFSYGKKIIFEQTSARFKVGSINVLTGKSGIGKTTLIDLLVGFHQPQAGQILIDKKPLSEISLESWRSLIGYVPQELILVEGTIFENITLSEDNLTERDIEDALEQAGALEFIAGAKNGIHANVGHLGLKFSGGQRQRISLARALVRRPKILILDEVTSSLDEKTEHEIIERIKLLSKDILIIAITHRPRWIEAADHIFTIENHKINEIQK